jgi:hypothetical protein
MANMAAAEEEIGGSLVLHDDDYDREQGEHGLHQRRLFHGSSSASLLSMQQQQQHQQPQRQQTSWLILAWSIHFISSVLVLIYSTQANQGQR